MDFGIQEMLHAPGFDYRLQNVVFCTHAKLRLH